MNGIARAGLVPGVDISVTGYDDLEEAAIATPALTTVWNGQREVGRRAARALLDKLNGRVGAAVAGTDQAGTACAPVDGPAGRALADCPSLNSGRRRDRCPIYPK